MSSGSKGCNFSISVALTLTPGPLLDVSTSQINLILKERVVMCAAVGLAAP